MSLLSLRKMQKKSRRRKFNFLQLMKKNNFELEPLVSFISESELADRLTLGIRLAYQ